MREGGRITGLSGGENEGEGPAVRVGCEMNLRAQPAAGPADGMVVRFACRGHSLRGPGRVLVSAPETAQFRSSSASPRAMSAVNTVHLREEQQNAVKSMVVTEADGRLLFCSPAGPASCADITHARQLGPVRQVM
ncbi:hypothetical protein OHS70_05125 [Streptomyces sp. NBC_00390]|uniref:hypothetical protein n=1 Tax=Streptomyces sp. NBC_00390 TaxID=2975736 RepID=UPI002E23842F